MYTQIKNTEKFAKDIKKLSELIEKNQGFTRVCVLNTAKNTTVKAEMILEILLNYYAGMTDMMLELPPEIKELILLGLPIKDILSFCSTSTTLKRVCESNVFWKILLKRDYDVAHEITLKNPKGSYMSLFKIWNHKGDYREQDLLEIFKRISNIYGVYTFVKYVDMLQTKFLLFSTIRDTIDPRESSQGKVLISSLVLYMEWLVVQQEYNKLKNILEYNKFLRSFSAMHSHVAILYTESTIEFIRWLFFQRFPKILNKKYKYKKNREFILQITQRFINATASKNYEENTSLIGRFPGDVQEIKNLRRELLDFRKNFLASLKKK